MPNLPPGPGTLHSLIFRRSPQLFINVARKYGDLAFFWVFNQPVIVISHPDLIKEVLVTQHSNFSKGPILQRAKILLGEGLLTSEPPRHTRQRRLIQPAFHRARLVAYAQTMSDYAARQAARWTDGATLDAHVEMMELTLAIVGKTLFDAAVERDADEVSVALHTLMGMFDLLSLPLLPLLRWLPFGPSKKFAREMERLNTIIYRLSDERRTQLTDRGDLLSMLLLAHDDDQTGMSNEQVRDEALTIFLAGHETTANALTWTWYLLSQHPEVEARFHAEIDSVLQGRLPTFADGDHLPYTRQVLAESMRLYPPAWIIARRALNAFSLGGYELPAGTTVSISQWVLHRDPRYFPDPECFDPERWTPEAITKRPKFSYFPFGGGPRVCVGESFAWMEGLLLLATIGQHWRLRLAPEHPIELLPSITLRPKHGMKMTVEKRD